MRFYGRKMILLGEKNDILLLCVRRHVPKSSARRMVTSIAADMMWAYSVGVMQKIFCVASQFLRRTGVRLEFLLALVCKPITT